MSALLSVCLTHVPQFLFCFDHCDSSVVLLLSGVLCLRACEKGWGGGGAILQGCALYLILLCGLKGMANVLQLVYFRSYYVIDLV